MVEYGQAFTDEEYAAAAMLFREYAASLDIDLGFQKFSEELNSLKSMYASPFGALILAKKKNEYIGCIAIRRIDLAIAELKRMYVRPESRTHGVGKKLLQAALKKARVLGYKRIRLDTLSNMSAAISLYKQQGFYEIPAYYFNPESTAVYFEKIL